MSDNLLRPNQYAKKIGRSRQAVSLAIKSGLLPTTEKDGIKYIDPDNIHVRAYAEGTTDKTGRRNGKEKPEKLKAGPGSDAKNPQNEKPVGEAEAPLPDYIKNLIDTGELTMEMVFGLTKSAMDKIKIYDSLKTTKQARMDRRRELVNVKFMRLLFGKIYDIDVNEFMAIKTRVKPMLSKVFETNDDAKLLEAEKVIDTELWETLARVKFEFNKFLEKVKHEQLSD